MTTPSVSPALLLRLPPGMSAADRDRLVSLLADHALVAIQEDDLQQPRLWTAHFGDAASRTAAATAVSADPAFAGLAPEPLDVQDEDWARRTQADLPAIRIGRVTIAPPWDVPAPAAEAGGKDPRQREVVVLIEPSRGFGTGHHQSTRLCLVLLQGRDLAGLTVTDVGTGSGVLAITAAKLGAAYVSAIDSDPDAIENARENIDANGVGANVEAHVDDLLTTTTAPADLVTANLTGSLLSQHAGDLARLVRPRGSLIVSGFNVDERERVTEALTPHFAISETAEEDDWFAFVVTRSTTR